MLKKKRENCLRWCLFCALWDFFFFFVPDFCEGSFYVKTQIIPKLESHLLPSQGLNALLSDELPSFRGP